MTAWRADVLCAECGHLRESISGDTDGPKLDWAVDEAECPAGCGSTMVNVAAYVEETLGEQRVSITLKGRPGEGGKPFYDSRIGDSYYRAENRWDFVEQTVDKRNDRYRKVIIDGVTGETLRHDDHPLSEKQVRDRQRREGGAG